MPDLPLIDTALIDRLLPLGHAIRAYLRGEVHGIEHIPDGPALLVGNHNAGVTFLEPVLLGIAWHECKGGEDGFFYLAHDVLMDLPGVGRLLAKGGAMRAGYATAEAAFAAGRKVAVWPGGNWEAFRPWRERHRVDFGGHTGFVRLALRARVPIVPVLSLGGHEAYFVLARGARIARWTGIKRRFRSESFPLFLALPWGIGLGPLPHLPLPVKSLVEVGLPISLAEHPPEAAADESLVRSIAQRVEGALQAMMDRRVAERRAGREKNEKNGTDRSS
ncbi:MAG: 1-acyl-sn-glycerol-3-phosphate acyltransferase [Pseudomonadota bacterium]